MPTHAASDRPRSRRAGVDTALRTAAVWGSVSALAARRRDELGRPLRVVDIGGGTGGLTVPLAEQGHHVVVVDPSPDALASLRRRAAESGVADRITALQGDAETAADLVAAQTGGADLV
ncbi:MAG: methyltransferase domain-containing protein, partial [Nostocoides sp.]